MISLINLFQGAYFLKNLFWTLILPIMTQENFFVRCIPSLWLDSPNSKDPDIFDDSTANLLDIQKVPKFLYSDFTKTSIPVNCIVF